MTLLALVAGNGGNKANVVLSVCVSSSSSPCSDNELHRFQCVCANSGNTGCRGYKVKVGYSVHGSSDFTGYSGNGKSKV